MFARTYIYARKYTVTKSLKINNKIVSKVCLQLSRNVLITQFSLMVIK